MLLLQSLSIRGSRGEAEYNFRCTLFTATFTSLDDFTSDIVSEISKSSNYKVKGTSQLQGRLKDKIDPNIVQWILAKVLMFDIVIEGK